MSKARNKKIFTDRSLQESTIHRYSSLGVFPKCLNTFSENDTESLNFIFHKFKLNLATSILQFCNIGWK